MEGILNILKPPGMTSHDVVAFLRRTLGIHKIGHCGTLDPQAAGVLPVCLGQATKLADYLAGGEKTYYCEMKLGYETDTQDIWGSVTAVYPPLQPDLTPDPAIIQQALRSLEGEILQEAPAYSAVKRDGKSLHRYAREGKPVTGIMRKAFVYSLTLVGAGEGVLRFVVRCGGGTYVRMLCRDLGRILQTGAVMSFLLRLRVGPFLLEDSVTLEEILQRKDADPAFLSGVLSPKELALRHLPSLAAKEDEVIRLRQGQSLWLAAPADEAPEGNLPGLQSLPADTGMKIWVKDEMQRLAALGTCTPGLGSHENQYLFKPDKTFH